MSEPKQVPCAALRIWSAGDLHEFRRRTDSEDPRLWATSGLRPETAIRCIRAGQTELGLRLLPEGEVNRALELSILGDLLLAFVVHPPTGLSALIDARRRLATEAANAYWATDEYGQIAAAVRAGLIDRHEAVARMSEVRGQRLHNDWLACTSSDLARWSDAWRGTRLRPDFADAEPLRRRGMAPRDIIEMFDRGLSPAEIEAFQRSNRTRATLDNFLDLGLTVADMEIASSAGWSAVDCASRLSAIKSRSEQILTFFFDRNFASRPDGEVGSGTHVVACSAHLQNGDQITISGSTTRRQVGLSQLRVQTGFRRMRDMAEHLEDGGSATHVEHRFKGEHIESTLRLGIPPALVDTFISNQTVDGVIVLSATSGVPTDVVTWSQEGPLRSSLQPGSPQWTPERGDLFPSVAAVGLSGRSVVAGTPIRPSFQ